MKNIFLSGLTLSCLLFAFMPIVSAQGTEYQRGLRLFEQRQFEEAYEVFSQLLRQQPNNYPILDQTISSLVELKRYDEGIEIIQSFLRGNYNDLVLTTRLAELYHLDEQYEKAYETWDLALNANSGAIQAYRYIGESLRNRREHERLVEVYIKARKQFNNETLFFSELTNGYMALRQYDKAINTLISIINVAPGNSTFVLRQLINFDDPSLLDLAIIELDEASRNVSRNSDQFIAYREILVGVLMERKLFRRALTTARGYESVAKENTWPVYNLGNRLRSQQQFELAEEAYKFYIEQSRHTLRSRSMEDLALLYVMWSRYLTLNNLDYDQKASDFYQKADETLQELLKTYPTYHRRAEVLSLKSEIALDHLKNVQKAEEYLELIKRLPDTNAYQMLSDYVSGRINMFSGRHSLARVSLTSANRTARTGEFADKTRYFLALNDFYAGDFEFASIQMRALERITTSYYANDALQLRLWIQQGVNQEEPTDELKKFAKARYLFDTGKTGEAINTLKNLITIDFDAPLRGDAVIMLSENLRTVSPAEMYIVLDAVLASGFRGAHRERLLWERVRIANGIRSLETPDKSASDYTVLTDVISTLVTRGRLQSKYTTIISERGIDTSELKSMLTTDYIFEMYEDILFEFPQGFYAEEIRTKLQNLQNHMAL